MTTIVNTPPTPPTTSDGGNSMVTLFVGIFFVAVVAFLFFAYGLPALRNTQSANTGNNAPTINVPDKVDINIKK